MTQLLTVAQVAETVGLSEHTVRRAIRDQELAATMIRRRLRVAPSDLAAWIDAGRVQPTGTGRPVVSPRSPLGGPATSSNVQDLISRQRRKGAA